MKKLVLVALAALHLCAFGQVTVGGTNVQIGGTTTVSPAPSTTNVLAGNGAGGFTNTGIPPNTVCRTDGTNCPTSAPILPSTTNIIKGNGSGGGADSGIDPNLVCLLDGTHCPAGGGMVYPGAGVPVSTGSAWGTSKAAPSGAIVGDTDTQTLTNKTIDGVTPTVMGYVDPVSSIQGQLNGKVAKAGDTMAGALNVPNQHANWQALTALGDSLTQGNQGSTGITYPNQLQALLGYQVSNLGIGGETSSQIAVRMNAWAGAPSCGPASPSNPCQVIAADFTIPTSGSVSISFPAGFEPVNNQYTVDFPSGLLISVGGVQGYVTTSDNVTYTFTPSAYPATTVSVHAGDPWTTVITSEYSGTVFVWAGRNNFASCPESGVTTANCQVAADINAMTAKLQQTAVNYLFMSVVNAAQTEPQGTSSYNKILAINSWLSSYAGANHYLDIRSLIVANYNPSSPIDVYYHGLDAPPYTMLAADVGGTLTASLGTTGCPTTSASVATSYVMTVGTSSNYEQILITGGSTTGGTATCTRSYQQSAGAQSWTSGTAYQGVDYLHFGANWSSTQNGYIFIAQQIYNWFTAQASPALSVKSIYSALNSPYITGETTGRTRVISSRSGALSNTAAGLSVVGNGTYGVITGYDPATNEAYVAGYQNSGTWAKTAIGRNGQQVNIGPVNTDTFNQLFSQHGVHGAESNVNAGYAAFHDGVSGLHVGFDTAANSGAGVGWMGCFKDHSTWAPCIINPNTSPVALGQATVDLTIGAKTQTPSVYASSYVRSASFTFDGVSSVTSKSSSGTQMVACPTGGSGFKTCNASGVWATPPGTLNVNVVAYSATPTFSASTEYSVNRIVLTGNVTSSTIASGSDGQSICFDIVQDATGGRTLVAPTNIQNFPSIQASPSAETFICGRYINATSKWVFPLPSYPSDLPNGTTATTQSAADNSTKVATTNYVDRAVASAGATRWSSVSRSTSGSITSSTLFTAPATALYRLNIGLACKTLNSGTSVQGYFSVSSVDGTTGLIYQTDTLTCTTSTNATLEMPINLPAGSAVNFYTSAAGSFTYDAAFVVEQLTAN